MKGVSISMAEPTLTVDDHRHGLYANSPIALLVLFLVCLSAFGIFSMLQITSTEQTVFDLLQIGIQIKPNMTGDQVAQIMNGTLGHNQTIADGIGWSVQIALLLLSMPPEHALAMMHRKYNTVASASLARHAEGMAKARQVLMWTLIGGDVITDFYYVIQGHGFTWDGWHPSFGGTAGVLLVGVIYPIGVCFVTIFVGKYMFSYLDALIDVVRGQPTTKKPATTAATK